MSYGREFLVAGALSGAVVAPAEAAQSYERVQFEASAVEVAAAASQNAYPGVVSADLKADTPYVTFAANRLAVTTENDPNPPAVPDDAAENARKLAAYCLQNNLGGGVAATFYSTGKRAKGVAELNGNKNRVVAQDTARCEKVSTRKQVNIDAVQVTKSGNTVDISPGTIKVTGPEAQSFDGRRLTVNACKNGVKSRRVAMKKTTVVVDVATGKETSYDFVTNPVTQRCK